MIGNFHRIVSVYISLSYEFIFLQFAILKWGSNKVPRLQLVLSQANETELSTESCEILIVQQEIPNRRVPRIF